MKFIKFKNYLEIKGSSIVDAYTLDKNIIPDSLLELPKMVDLWAEKLRRMKIGRGII